MPRPAWTPCWRGTAPPLTRTRRRAASQAPYPVRRPARRRARHPVLVRAQVERRVVRGRPGGDVGARRARDGVRRCRPSDRGRRSFGRTRHRARARPGRRTLVLAHSATALTDADVEAERLSGRRRAGRRADLPRAGEAGCRADPGVLPRAGGRHPDHLGRQSAHGRGHRARAGSRRRRGIRCPQAPRRRRGARRGARGARRVRTRDARAEEAHGRRAAGQRATPSR